MASEILVTKFVLELLDIAINLQDSRLIDSVFFTLLCARFLTEIKSNSAHTFPCYCIKQTDTILPCVCSVIYHRKRQNVVRTSVTHLATPHVPIFLFLPHFNVICDLLPNRRMATKYSTAQRVHYSTIQYSTVHYYSTIQCSTAQHSQYIIIVQYNTAQYSTVQYSKSSTMQYSTIQHNTLVQYSTVQCSKLSKQK